MSVQIRDIVIYSHDGRRRELVLRPGNVSIVTGASKSGKSALIDVVDYCFGSGECHVPEGPIRRSIGWFGLRLQLETGPSLPRQRWPGGFSALLLSSRAFADPAADYLAQAAKEKRAKKTASGLVYRSLSEGSGAKPTAASTVKVKYRRTFIDGRVFDQGGPVSFPLGGVIPCWTEGVQLMKVGGTAKLVRPSSIAYGERGAPGAIPPNAMLVFEVELLAIEK